MEQQQMEAAFHASNLIFQYLGGVISPREQLELDAWIAESENNKLLFELLTNSTQLNELLNEFCRMEERKKYARRKLNRRLFTYKTKILQLTARVWKYVA